MAHSRLPPSGAERWFACPGSIAACDGIPEVTSSYAAEGTRAHDLLNAALMLEQDPRELIDPTIDEQVEMAEEIMLVVDYVRQYQHLDPSAQYYPEVRLEWGAPFGRTDLFGTGDVIIVANDELASIDLKYGKGVVVEVEENLQQLIYLLGARHKFGKRERYQISIAQPRARHKDGPMRITYVSDATLSAFAQQVRDAVTATEAPDAPRFAGPHCRWCRAAGRCPTLADYAMRSAAEEFTVIEALEGRIMQPRPVENLTTAQIAKLLAHVPAVKKWIDALLAEAMDRALKGDRLQGYKLVPGKNARAWHNPDDTQKDFVLMGFDLDDFSPRTFVSPAQAEKLMIARKVPVKERAPIFDGVVKVAGAPTLASEIDPRPEFIPMSEFGVLPNVD